MAVMATMEMVEMEMVEMEIQTRMVEICCKLCTNAGTLGLNSEYYYVFFEYGASRTLPKDCPKVQDQNRGNKARVPDARGKAYVLGGGDANPGSNTVTGTFLLNDHHTYMLFDPDADRSFVSNTFSTLLDIIPSALDDSYGKKTKTSRREAT
ncbi:hypothetical protein Tco_0179445 [Tanacetum coccineum]